jgi:hypothetical protein
MQAHWLSRLATSRPSSSVSCVFCRLLLPGVLRLPSLPSPPPACPASPAVSSSRVSCVFCRLRRGIVAMAHGSVRE